MTFSLQLLPELLERLQARALELLHPAVVDLVDGHGVQEVQLLAPPPHGADEVRVLEQRQVLRDGLPAHVHLLAELAEREAGAREQAVQELPPSGICERLEHRVHPSLLLLRTICKHSLACQPQKNALITTGSDPPR